TPIFDSGAIVSWTAATKAMGPSQPSGATTGATGRCADPSAEPVAVTRHHRGRGSSRRRGCRRLGGAGCGGHQGALGRLSRRQSNYAAPRGGGVDAPGREPGSSLSAPTPFSWCRLWCRLRVDEEITQSKEREVAISRKCAGDHGFPRIHAEITPPPR